MNESACCVDARAALANPRHLWSEHDSTRHYTDPDGWAAHVRACWSCEVISDTDEASA